MHIAQIWRYPVKSMSGERLRAAELGALGVRGDRDLAVLDGQGRILSARTRPALLRLHAVHASSGATLVDGLDWRSAEVARRVRAAAGPGARLEPITGAGRFDVLPLSVVTDGAVAALGVDPRRLRPNLLIAGVEGLAERSWEGRFLGIGDAVIGLAGLRPRCVMTTFDPDTALQDLSVLTRIRERFEGTFALDAWVVRPGRIAEGDEVRPVEGIAGGWEPAWGRFARSASAGRGAATAADRVPTPG